MKIFDCFMYFNEEVLLDLRLNILDKYVDYFVIVESIFTHRGDKRKLKFSHKKFEKFKDKIIYLIYDKEPNDIEEVLSNDSEEEKSRKYFNELLSYSNHLGLFSEDLDFKSKYLIGTLTLIITFGYIVYLIIVRVINSLFLSINTFSTLGFGQIPVKGFIRYVTILEGFLGWFLLSVFIVSLLNQIMNT